MPMTFWWWYMETFTCEWEQDALYSDIICCTTVHFYRCWWISTSNWANKPRAVIKFAAAYAAAPVLSHAELSECGFQKLCKAKRVVRCFTTFSSSFQPVVLQPQFFIVTVDAIFKQGDGPLNLPMSLSNPSFIFYTLWRKLETASNFTASMNMAWDCCPSDYRVRYIML